MGDHPKQRKIQHSRSIPTGQPHKRREGERAEEKRREGAEVRGEAEAAR